MTNLPRELPNDIPRELHDELGRLLSAQRDGELAADDAARLRWLVANNAQAREMYVYYSLFCGSLEWDHTAWNREHQGPLSRAPAASAPVVGGLSQFSFDENGTVSLLPDQSEIQNPKSQIPNSSPILGFLGSAYHGISGYIGDHEWAQGVLGGTVFLALLFAVLGSIENPIITWRATRLQPQDNQVVDVPAVRAARLTGVYDCRWTGSFHPPRNEVLNVDDYINLASGLAEVTYDSGAKVLLQGPCTYKIESPSSGYLRVGRLTARVKGNEELRTKKEELPAPTSSLPLPTSSFVVNTPTATVTDLGTEFGVDVDGVGATDSLVFVGSVKVNTVVDDGQKQAGVVTLKANESARVERQQGGKQYVVRRDVVKPEGFVRPDQIQEWLAMVREAAAKRQQEAEEPKEPPLDLTQFHRWQNFSKELCQRDDLLAYYDFQWDPNDKRDEWNHQLLRNKAKTAPGIFGRHYDGQLWGAITMGMTEGRFPGKHALKFDCRDDGVKVDIPVACQQMTLVTWVQVEQLARPLNALFCPQQWNSAGQVAWQINNAGKLIFSVHGAFAQTSVLPTDALRTAMKNWCCLAVAYDSNRGQTRCYINGALLADSAVSGRQPAIIGQAWIGSFPGDPPDPNPGHRTIRAGMDEFMIFKAALSSEEIGRIYEEGKPATKDQ